jgi:electron transport complex protein RnfA
MNLISLFINSVLIENVILMKYLGICPMVGTYHREKSTLYSGIIVTFVILVTSLMSYLIYYYILVPSNTTYLRTIIFILVIALLIQLIQLIMKKVMNNTYLLIQNYLPFITTNCAVLGILLLIVQKEYNLSQTIVYALGSSIGFTLITYIFSSIRERLDSSPIVKAFRGFPIGLITIGIMSMIFSRYIGG